MKALTILFGMMTLIMLYGLMSAPRKSDQDRLELAASLLMILAFGLLTYVSARAAGWV